MAPDLERTTGTTGVNRIVASTFGVRLVSDVPERLCRYGLRPWLSGKRRLRLDRIRESRLLFIHVPKNAGTSICDRLYGGQMKHGSVQYYACAAPDLLALPSFALVRDPVDRFLSAYRYAQAGGSCHRTISEPFASATPGSVRSPMPSSTWHRPAHPSTSITSSVRKAGTCWTQAAERPWID